MNLLARVIAPLCLSLLAAPALAEKIPLKSLSAYLNALPAVSSDFTQVNADGSVTLGTIKIQRPGRVRFEYAAPDNSLVLAYNGSVAVFDAKSNQPPEQYPLKQTPLSLILDANVNLGRSGMVVSHKEDGTATVVRAQDPEHPEYGSIQLVFTDNPLALRQWVITDDLGQETTVILGELRPAANFPVSTFSIEDEKSRRGF